MVVRLTYQNEIHSEIVYARRCVLAENYVPLNHRFPLEMTIPNRPGCMSR